MDHEGDGLGYDPHRDRPRSTSRREVTLRLNRVAEALNKAHEELSGLRHELGVEERLADMQERLSHRRSEIVTDEIENRAPTWAAGGEEE